MELSGKITAFFDGTDVKLIHVTEVVKNNLQVRNENGKKFKIPAKNIITPIETATYENFSSNYQNLKEEIDSLSNDIETELLWEMVVDDNREYKIEELADNYFGEKEAKSLCALFTSLVADSVHFKRKGLHIIPRTAEQVEEQKQVIKRKQEKEAFKERVIPWLGEVIKSEKVDNVPDEFKQFLNLLEVFLYNRRQNEASKILAQVAGENSLKEAVYDVLVKCAILDENSDRFLVLAGIDEKFSQRVLASSEEISKEYSKDFRADYTEILTYSIDDADTKDIDDALSVESLENGNVKVGIHIADVSAYINTGDILDDEAAKRVTSIYLPSRTVHMFPSCLSQNRVSLVAGDTRPAMSFFIEFNDKNEMLDWGVKLTEVHVDHKLSYDGADGLLDESGEISESLNRLQSISQELQKIRMEKGAALFNRPELKIRVRDNQVSVKVLERNSPTRNLVSEFMILANSIAALYCARNDVPIIYRTQDKPEGLPEMDPDIYDPILFEQSIKCMKKSRLSLHPASHGGLGADFYTQLTSPIRRYTDLVMQRQLGKLPAR